MTNHGQSHMNHTSRSTQVSIRYENISSITPITDVSWFCAIACFFHSVIGVIGVINMIETGSHSLARLARKHRDASTCECLGAMPSHGWLEALPGHDRRPGEPVDKPSRSRVDYRSTGSGDLFPWLVNHLRFRRLADSPGDSANRRDAPCLGAVS